MAPELVARQTVTRLTMTRFGRRPFKYGSGDCIVMGRFHLTKAKVKVPTLPQYKSLKGAVAALKARGCDSIEELLDSIGLQRIPPAMMRLGDIATMEAHDGLSGLVIAEGQMVFGYHRDDLSRPHMIVPYEYTGAWRVPFGGSK